ncbi:hypothetical protein L3Q82_017910 [Scortum barcoo]|uniref:Uncharacterized protein n=1 Tax=Scortum barcoo TaxID=214431 RepID=A0ACB8VJC9_9TELE|nr:hypothetical protein L3Q82_017910 [Scortum barcoo]
MRFSSWSWNTGTSSIPSTGCLRVYGNLPNQSTCALWIWRRHSTVSLVVNGILWGVLRVWGPGAFSKGCSVSVRPEQELGSHCRQTFSMCWSGLQTECEVAGMRISTSKSEAMVLDRNKGGVPSPGVVEMSCLKWRSSSISESCSRVRERWSVRLTGGLVQRPQLCAIMSVYWTVVVKKELSRKASEALDLPYRSIPRLPPHLWS